MVPQPLINATETTINFNASSSLLNWENTSCLYHLEQEALKLHYKIHPDNPEFFEKVVILKMAYYK